MRQELLAVERVAGQGVHAHRQAHRGDGGFSPNCVLACAQALAGGEPKGLGHADGHGFTMQQVLAIAAFGLQGVAEGVAEIEQGPAAGFPFVLRHDFRLHLHRASHGEGQVVGRQGGDLAAMGFQPGEEVDVAQQAVLDDLGVARPDFPRRQGREHVQVGQHQPGLMKGADQVLAPGRVDGGLAAHRGVHLRKQGGRDLHEIDAALVDRRGETGEVAHHAAAEGDDQISAVQFKGQQIVADPRQHVEALGAFTGGNQHRRRADPLGRQGRGQGCAMQTPDGLVADDRGPPALEKRADMLTGLGQQACSDAHLIGSVAEADGDGLDHAPSSERYCVRASMT